MSQLKITINNRAYDVACEEGQEDRLRDVAGLLGEKVDQLVASVGQVGDSRLLLMAGLLIADELYDTKAALANKGGILGSDGEVSSAAGEELEEARKYVTDVFNELSGRLEGLAGRLDGGAPAVGSPSAEAIAS